MTQGTNLKSLLIEGYFRRLSKKCRITTNSGPGPLRPRGPPHVGLWDFEILISNLNIVVDAIFSASTIEKY